MTKRRTTPKADRTPLASDCDVLICGASFAGLAVARELSRLHASARKPRVLLIDRYEIGERQTSACAAPTQWLSALGLSGSIRQTFGELCIHTPYTTARYRLPWSFSTFDYSALCELLASQSDAEFATATVTGKSQDGIITDRGAISAPYVVDCLGWRRVLSASGPYQPPDAPLSRGLEVHPRGSGRELAIFIDRRYVPAGYGWSFPAADELRIGVGSFDPRFHVKDPTVELATDTGYEPARYQGNWIPHRLRPATEDGVFFCGDSAGHCLPLTAEGIRTAFYFGIACGRTLGAAVCGDLTKAEALSRYHAFSAGHHWQFHWMLRMQRLVPRVPPRVLTAAIRAMGSQRFVNWAFAHYLNIAAPEFANAKPSAEAAGSVSQAA